MSRRLASTIFDVSIDLELVLLPSTLFWRLRMPWNKKVKVTLAFSGNLV